MAVEQGRGAADDAARRSRLADLTEAEALGRVWVLADEAADLTRVDTAAIAPRLSACRRVALAERTPRLHGLLGLDERIALPDLSPLSLTAFIACVALGRGKRLPQACDLWPERESAATPMPPLAWPDLAAKAWTNDPARYHPGAVTEAWAHRLPQPVCGTPPSAACLGCPWSHWARGEWRGAASFTRASTAS